MSFCENCGSELPEGKLTCPNCGAPVQPEEYEEREYSGYDYYDEYYGSRSRGGYASREPVYTYAPVEKTPERVLGTGAFFASILIMSIPVIGFFIQIIWAAGGTSSRNRRNLARAYLIFSLISLALTAVMLWYLIEAADVIIDSLFRSL